MLERFKAANRAKNPTGTILPVAKVVKLEDQEELRLLRVQQLKLAVQQNQTLLEKLKNKYK